MKCDNGTRKWIFLSFVNWFSLHVRLGAMQRELKMKELQLLDATRRKFLTYQQQQKESELARLDDEIRRKVCNIIICLSRKER